MNATTNGMKKLLACLTLCALLLSLGTFFASADDLPEWIQFTPGAYLDGNADEFAPVGDITVAWLPDVSDRVDMTDGDLSDWYALGLTATNIDAHNMIAWVGDSTVVGDFKITSFAAADSDYLYLAFDIVDDDFVYNTEDVIFGGDTIQLSIDFGGMMKKTLENEPDVLSNPKGIFYTFFCKSDGAPIRIMRQEADQDGWLTEANGDGVKGAARKTENGWSAEIALSWQLMYDDYVWKAWAEDPMVYIGSEQHLPLQVSACLYYVNYGEDGEIQWAAGTTRPWLNDEGAPCVSWTAYDNGLQLVLPWEEGLQINCTGVRPIYVFYPSTETRPPETEPPYDPPVEETETVTAAVDLPLWTETLPPEVEETLRDAAESLDKEDELNAVLAKYGCTAVVSMGGLTVLVTVAAAAFVIRKKK